MLVVEFAKERYRQLCREEATIPLFSQDWWLDIVCGEAAWDVLIVSDRTRLVAAMPLYLPTRRVVSMPCYTQRMGPWFAEPSSDTKVTAALGYRQQICTALAKRLDSFTSFFQNFNYDVTDWLPFYWEGYVQTTKYSYLLPSIQDEELLWSQMSQNVRRNISKAKAASITVKRGISFDDFAAVQAETFARQQQKNRQDPRILRQLVEVSRARGEGDLWGGYDEEQRLHAAAFVVWGKEAAYYIAGGASTALRQSGAHSLVLWQAIRAMAATTETFDFEGSMLPGVERFFREFGGVQTPYFTISRGKLSLLDRVLIKRQMKSRTFESFVTNP